MPRAAPKKPKSRSGPNIPEAQRGTVQRKLRLSIETDRRLLELVEDGGYEPSNQISGTVAALIDQAWEEWQIVRENRALKK